MYNSLPRFHSGLAPRYYTSTSTIKKSQVDKSESEITFLTINCAKVRHDLPLPYSPCMTDAPRRPSHYANYTHCLVTKGESESFQLAITSLYYSK